MKDLHVRTDSLFEMKQWRAVAAMTKKAGERENWPADPPLTVVVGWCMSGSADVVLWRQPRVPLVDLGPYRRANCERHLHGY